jgi:hypothetical protein
VCLAFLPFGGKLDPGNQWILLSTVIPWWLLEGHYAPFCAESETPADNDIDDCFEKELGIRPPCDDPTGNCGTIILVAHVFQVIFAAQLI